MDAPAGYDPIEFVIKMKKAKKLVQEAMDTIGRYYGADAEYSTTDAIYDCMRDARDRLDDHF